MPWLAMTVGLFAVFGTAAGIWHALLPDEGSAPVLAAGPESDQPQQAAPGIDLAALNEPDQHRVAFSGEDSSPGNDGSGDGWRDWPYQLVRGLEDFFVALSGDEEVPAAPETTKFGDSLSNDDILANLATVVFGSEFVGEDSDHVRKWVGPMRVAVYGDDDGDFDDLVEAHLASLQILTGLDIARVDQEHAERNAHILFLSRSQFNSYAETYLSRGKPGTNRNIACFGIFKSNKREILEFHAMIPRGASRREVKACIIEELTQVLGLPNDSFDIRPSIFNDDDEFHTLTWQDELFLRVLYDERVEPGMNRRQFERMARGIIGELRPEGVDMMLAVKPEPQPVPEGASEVVPASFPVTTETPRLTRDRGQP